MPVQACWAFRPRTCSIASCRSLCLFSTSGNATTPRHVPTGCKVLAVCGLQYCTHVCTGCLQPCVTKAPACRSGAAPSSHSASSLDPVRCLGVGFRVGSADARAQVAERCGRAIHHQLQRLHLPRVPGTLAGHAAAGHGRVRVHCRAARALQPGMPRACMDPAV